VSFAVVLGELQIVFTPNCTYPSNSKIMGLTLGIAALVKHLR